MKQQQPDDSTNAAIEKPKEFFEHYPRGFKFNPYDAELITHYLQPMINGDILSQNFMHEVNIYKHHPSFLAEHYTPQGEGAWYFLTPRDKKYKNGTRPDRKAGDGFWKATGSDTKILNQYKRVIGYRKGLVYYEGKPTNSDKTEWIMHEFRVQGPSRALNRSFPNEDTGMRLDDYVLCKIYKKQNREGKGERKEKEEKKPSRPKKAAVAKTKETLSAVPSKRKKTKKNPCSSAANNVDCNGVSKTVNCNLVSNSFPLNALSIPDPVLPDTINQPCLPLDAISIADLCYEDPVLPNTISPMSSHLPFSDHQYGTTGSNNNTNGYIWNFTGPDDQLYSLLMQEANSAFTSSPVPPSLNQMMDSTNFFAASPSGQMIDSTNLFAVSPSGQMMDGNSMSVPATYGDNSTRSSMSVPTTYEDNSPGNSMSTYGDNSTRNSMTQSVPSSRGGVGNILSASTNQSSASATARTNQSFTSASASTSTKYQDWFLHQDG